MSSYEELGKDQKTIVDLASGFLLILAKHKVPNTVAVFAMGIVFREVCALSGSDPAVTLATLGKADAVFGRSGDEK